MNNIMKKTAKSMKKNKKIIKSKTLKIEKAYKNGGKYLSEGSFGWILGEPAYPCDDDDTKNKEKPLQNLISKISKTNLSQNEMIEGEKENFQHEWEGAQIIKNIKNIKNVKNIDNYFILPLKKCKVNMNYATKYPYIYNDSWRAKPIIDKDNKLKLAVLNIENKNMLLFDKADDDLDRIFYKLYQDVKDFNTFHINNKKMFNILKGVQILQNNNLIHNDLKTVNCVEHDGKFKIIDLADIRDFIKTKDMKLMPECFTYFIWPSTVAYTHFFTQMNSPTKMTIEILKNNYIKHNEFNDIQLQKMIKRYIYDSFTWFTIDDEPEMVNNINEYLNKLIYQKTFGIIENAATMNTDALSKELTKFATFFKSDFYPSQSKYSENDENEITIKVNNYLQEFDKIIEKIGKEGLLKRVDIYSFGIIILNNIMILSYCINESYKITINITKTPIKYYLYKLYQIVFYCCYQTENEPDIDLIVNYYETIMSIFDMVTNNPIDSPLYTMGINYIKNIPDINTITSSQFNDFLKKLINEKSTIMFEEELNKNSIFTKTKPKSEREKNIERSKNRSKSRSRSRSRSRSKSREISPITKEMEINSV